MTHDAPEPDEMDADQIERGELLDGEPGTLSVLPLVAISIDYLIEMATAARLFIEPFWADWHDAWGGERPQLLSRNTWSRTSLFLVEALRHKGIAAEWKSGVPRHSEIGPEISPCGFYANGRWESHAWVEAGGFIVDITADQFGDAPVIVVPADDERYCAGGRDTALPLHVEHRARAIGFLWPRWIELREEPAVVAFLVSPEVSYITGTDILVDGGTISGVEATGGAMKIARSK